MKHYLNVKEGNNSWPRYLASILLAVGFMIAGSIVYFIVELLRVELDGNDNTYIDLDTGMVVGGNGTVSLLMTHIIYIIALVGLWIGVRFIHKRKFRTLITGEERVNWKKVIWGFAVFTGLFLITSGADFLFNAADYTWNNVSFTQFGFLLLVVLLFVPIQTTVEELLFRGLLLQWIGKKLKNPILLALAVGVIFGALHFANPEMDDSAILVGLDYLLAGFALTFIAVKTGSLELSIGAHAANNMMIFLLFTYDNSVAGDIPSLFRIIDTSPQFSLIWSLIIFGVFYLLCKKKYGTKPSV
ncbi:type II CAAX endopeptidase family protein [Niallia alba]|uniref:CPBP family intramembrane metalloprotease n=1 Tax=Niallia circulans TaxID=1397 RepID=A0A941GGV4_NIACI|nr:MULTISPECIES: type II CAAX endopeptidase family protein [Niallia]MCB5237519.1 CPBP family intramembrane metalloprotease [Niallia circulans]MDU1845879.1 type II CAAX endopeptidase family protein [Niallia nealsonii]MED3794207.1 type II CAAX endopeptidase family protein [Niallia alba]